MQAGLTTQYSHCPCFVICLYWRFAAGQISKRCDAILCAPHNKHVWYCTKQLHNCKRVCDSGPDFLPMKQCSNSVYNGHLILHTTSMAILLSHVVIHCVRTLVAAALLGFGLGWSSFSDAAMALARASSSSQLVVEKNQVLSMAVASQIHPPVM